MLGNERSRISTTPKPRNIEVPPLIAMPGTDSFEGFHRPDGQIGTRNRLLVLSITGLTGPSARRISACLPGSLVVDYPYDSGPLGDDRESQDRALVGFAVNPNVGAVLIVSANPPRADDLAGRIVAGGKPIEVVVMDDRGHDAVTLTEHGIRLGARLTKEISAQRRRQAPLSSLYLGLECGRSDPSSGLVANPLMGLIADRLIDLGGTAIIGESTEWLGAEHLLAERAISEDVGRQIIDAVTARERAAIDGGRDLTGDNPGPTNIAAGLSTIEEKSLGNIAKSGNRPIQSLIQWAERPDGPGMHLMDAPAYAPESLSGFAAAGCQLMIFSTGVGNSFVNSISPTIKISANPETCERLQEQLDFKCPDVFVGKNTLDAAADDLMKVLVDVASGTLTWGEIHGEGAEAFSRMGASL